MLADGMDGWLSGGWGGRDVELRQPTPCCDALTQSSVIGSCSRKRVVVSFNAASYLAPVPSCDTGLLSVVSKLKMTHEGILISKVEQNRPDLLLKASSFRFQIADC